MEYFSMGWMYMYEGTRWLGRIYLKIQLWWWLLVGWRGGVLEHLSGTYVWPREYWHRDMVEVDKGRGLLGNFQVSETKVNSKTNQWKENSLETEKFFRREKTLLTSGTNFRDVTNLPPLKRISSRDSGTNKDSRGYTRYFLYGLIHPYIFKIF